MGRIAHLLQVHQLRVPESKAENVKELFSWFFGDEEGNVLVIEESRDRISMREGMVDVYRECIRPDAAPQPHNQSSLVGTYEGGY